MPRSGWGFDSPSPHQLTSRAGSLVRTAVCKTAEPGPIPGRLSTLSDCPRRPREGRPSSKRLRCGFESRRGLSFTVHSLRPHRLAGQGLRVLTPATRVRIPLGTPTAWICQARSLTSCIRIGAWLSLARAPVWGTGDRRFESGRPDRDRRLCGQFSIVVQRQDDGFENRTYGFDSRHCTSSDRRPPSVSLSSLLAHGGRPGTSRRFRDA